MKQGFTLLELSIVLVIIGLIIGGITVGSDMIRSAELNSVISEMQKLSVATNSFKMKYNGFPGDIKNATAYWGAGAGACSTITAICDGNGNGKIGGTSTEWSSQTEFVGFWTHLEQAEMFKMERDTISPARKLFKNFNNISVSVAYRQPLSFAYWALNDANLNMRAKHGLYFISTTQSGGSWVDGAISGIDLHTIDQKIDDGTAARGVILAKNGNNAPSGQNCVLAGEYHLAEATASATCTAMWYFD